jgi:RNA polymerase sigma-70 factor (ECF subfamily)
MAAREKSEHLERKIAESLGQGELKEAISQGIKGYAPQVLGYLTTLLRDEDAAQEVFARACERLWKAAPRFRLVTTFRAWLYRIAWNAARDYLADPYRRRGRALRTADISELAARTRSNTRPHARSSVRGRVARLREQLEPAEQTLLTLRVNRGLSWREIAEVLSRPGLPEDEATLRKRYERIKRKLRELAAAEGLLEGG